ncbi:hypothetical protein [Streptomyces sp. NPDC005017]|uniref:hypothetical protein n=1 Tax=Streptomyces sp. NPDC005017 TaxID=3364706 RepID=UPI0036A4E843
MIVTAALLLPGLCALLLLLDRFENWLSAPSSRPRHARARRHLRAVPGDGPGTTRGRASGRAARRAHAA